jgi:hypothetical protein
VKDIPITAVYSLLHPEPKASRKRSVFWLIKNQAFYAIQNYGQENWDEFRDWSGESGLQKTETLEHFGLSELVQDLKQIDMNVK